MTPHPQGCLCKPCVKSRENAAYRAKRKANGGKPLTDRQAPQSREFIRDHPEVPVRPPEPIRRRPLAFLEWSRGRLAGMRQGL